MKRKSLKEKYVPTYLAKEGVYHEANCGARFAYREKTHDLLVIKSLLVGNHPVETTLEATPDDVWFDVGAHIGVFSVLVVKRGFAKHVHAFEPDPTNFAFLKKNVALNKLEDVVTCHPVAIAAHSGKRFLHIRGDGLTAVSSFVARRGRYSLMVETLGINNALTELKPTLLKIDCEGAEAEIIPAVKQFGTTKGLYIEYHFSLLREINNLANCRAMMDFLRRKFRYVKGPEKQTCAYDGKIYAKYPLLRKRRP